MRKASLARPMTGRKDIMGGEMASVAENVVSGKLTTLSWAT